MTHKEEMRERRIRQLGRVAGFTPVASSRVNRKFDSAVARHMKAGKEEKVAQQMAMAEVRAGLPHPGFVRTRPFHSRSKYPVRA